MATLLLAGIGAAAGYGAFGTATFLGVSAAGWGWTAGSLLGNALFGPSVPDSHGPRLSDLSVTSGTEGADMARLWGRCRVQGRPVWAAPLVEHANTQSAGGKGGGGGSYTSYTYTGSFAVSFGQVPPGSKLRKLYANKELIYDASADADAVSAGYRFTFYDGSQTQPDPIIESYVGAGNAPAFMGQAILVADDWDLTSKFGNRPPLIEAEICTNGTSSVVSSSLLVGDGADSLQQLVWSPYLQRLLGAATNSFATIQGRIAEIDPAAGELIKTHTFSGLNGIYIMAIGMAGETGTGKWLWTSQLNPAGDDVVRIYDLTQDWAVVDQYSTADNGLRPLAESDALVLYTAGTGLKTWDKLGGAVNTFALPSGHTLHNGGVAVHVGSGDFLVALDRTSDGALIWAKYADGAWDTSHSTSYTGTLAVFLNAVVDDDGSVWWPANDTAPATDIPILVQTDAAGAELQVIDLNALGMANPFVGTASGTPTLFYSRDLHGLTWRVSGTIYLYRISTGELVTYAAANGGGWAYYHANSGTVWTGDENTGSNQWYIYSYRLDVVEPQPYAVSDIITDLCAEAGLDTATELDVSAMTATVAGFTHTRQTSARSDLEPLLATVLAEAVVSDWQLKVVPLGGAVVATIPAGDLGARADTEEPGAPLELTEPESIDLPGTFQLRYLSTDRDLQPAMVESKWGAAGSGRTVTVDVSVTMSDADASTLCQQMHQLACERVVAKFRLPRRWAALESCDPIELPVQGKAMRFRLTKVDDGANGVRACEAISDLVSHMVADAVAGGSGLTAAKILSSSPAQLLVLDTPLLRDTDADHPGPYLSAFTYGPGFPGVALNSSADGQNYVTFGAVTSEPVAGTCETVPVAVDFEAWDDTNTLRVTLRTAGSFSSTTDTDLLKHGANAVAWGRPGRWEVVQFGTASQVDATTWDLSHLLRGRRGTDVQADKHQVGDWFVLLNTATLARHVLAAANVGQDWYYKAPRNSEPLSDVAATDWVVGDEPLQPYSPVGLQATEDTPTNDLTLTATARTRRGGTLGGANGITDGIGSPGSEVTGYRFQILDNVGAVLNTYDSATLSRTYTKAQQIADYGGLPFDVFWRVAPISSLVAGVSRYSATGIFNRWTPASIGVDAWFDANDSSTLTLSGSNVTQWADKGLFGGDWLEQPTSGQQPTLVSPGQNGLDIIRFDGVDDFLRFTANYGDLLRNVGGATIFRVAKWRSTPAAEKHIVCLLTNTTTSRAIIGSDASGHHRLVGRRLDSDAAQVLPTAAAVGAGYQIQCGWIDYANSDAANWIDGTQDGSTTTFQTDGNTSDTASLYTATEGSAVGAYFSAGTPYGVPDIDLGEILIFRSALSTADRQKVEGYLAHKWGIAANLPAGHPYKSSPP